MSVKNRSEGRFRSEDFWKMTLYGFLVGGLATVIWNHDLEISIGVVIGVMLGSTYAFIFARKERDGIGDFLQSIGIVMMILVFLALIQHLVANISSEKFCWILSVTVGYGMGYSLEPLSFSRRQSIRSAMASYIWPRYAGMACGLMIPIVPATAINLSAAGTVVLSLMIVVLAAVSVVLSLLCWLIVRRCSPAGR